jgi:hypothetical protein
MISIRAEMGKVLVDWPGWPSFWTQCRRGGVEFWLDLIKAIASGTAYLIFLVLYKCYEISAYPLSYIWPWSSRNKEHRARRREEEGFQHLVLKPSDNVLLILSSQAQNQDATQKNKNYLLHRIPFEIRRQILILAFGEQTVHMDLQFQFPFNLVDKKRYEGWDIHARIQSTSLAMDSHLDKSEGQSKKWRWFSCVCHRFPPNATQLSLGRRRNYPWSHFRDPDTDRCLGGSGKCNEWPGEWPGKCQIGIIGWLLSCKQA